MFVWAVIRYGYLLDYPCPLVSVRNRKPVYGEIGHTIMNLLADFHNFQYTLPQIRGLLIHMEEKQTCVRFPRSQYSAVSICLECSIYHSFHWPSALYVLHSKFCCVLFFNLCLSRAVICVFLESFFVHPSTFAASSDYWWWSGVKEGTLTQLL